jgi:hypothetical protein
LPRTAQGELESADVIELTFTGWILLSFGVAFYFSGFWIEGLARRQGITPPSPSAPNRELRLRRTIETAIRLRPQLRRVGAGAGLVGAVLITLGVLLSN